ncbi:MAG: sigma-70 family RNA polymerase sigma factor, partial [Opitutales bacterium]|nr:sigma-70 family RNA polymerase sigma factor [Opitutales bacterium]
KKTMTRLPERYQEILKMYYFKNMRLSEIATIYQVSEARICQIHTQAVKRMGTMMRQMV